jgi:hypothetical protein
MKQSVLVGLSVLALAACTPQPSPQMGAGTQPIIPAAYAAGSPGNTTSGFDGTYIGGTIQNISYPTSSAARSRRQNFGQLTPISFLHQAVGHSASCCRLRAGDAG